MPFARAIRHLNAVLAVVVDGVVAERAVEGEGGLRFAFEVVFVVVLLTISIASSLTIIRRCLLFPATAYILARQDYPHASNPHLPHNYRFCRSDPASQAEHKPLRPMACASPLHL